MALNTNSMSYTYGTNGSLHLCCSQEAKRTGLLFATLNTLATTKQPLPLFTGVTLGRSGVLISGDRKWLHLPSFLAAMVPVEYSQYVNRVVAPGDERLLAFADLTAEYTKFPRNTPHSMQNTIPLMSNAMITACMVPNVKRHAPVTLSPAAAPAAAKAPLLSSSSSSLVPPVPDLAVNDERVSSVVAYGGMMDFYAGAFPILETLQHPKDGTHAEGSVFYVVALTKPWVIAPAYTGIFRVEIPGLPMILARNCPNVYHMFSFLLDERHNGRKMYGSGVERFSCRQRFVINSFSITRINSEDSYLVLDRIRPGKKQYVAIKIDSESSEYLREMFASMAKMRDDHCADSHAVGDLYTYQTKTVGASQRIVVQGKYPTPGNRADMAPLTCFASFEILNEDLPDLVAVVKAMTVQKEATPPIVKGKFYGYVMGSDCMIQEMNSGNRILKLQVETWARFNAWFEEMYQILKE